MAAQPQLPSYARNVRACGLEVSTPRRVAFVDRLSTAGHHQARMGRWSCSAARLLLIGQLPLSAPLPVLGCLGCVFMLTAHSLNWILLIWDKFTRALAPPTVAVLADNAAERFRFNNEHDRLVVGNCMAIRGPTAPCASVGTWVQGL